MPIGRLDVNTKFHIDLGWWESQGRNFREELYESLCDPCKQRYAIDEQQVVDRIDPLTGEVTRLNALWECVMDECGRSSDYVGPKVPLTRAIFRALIANGNAPLSAAELHKRIGKSSPQAVLRTLLSPEMEMDGIVPVGEG